MMSMSQPTRRSFLRSAIGACAVSLMPRGAGAGERPDGIFVEAEQFRETGGWVSDAQHIGAMGSAYLLAHGMGRPVADAVTQVRVEKGGRHRLWVRTRDWAAPGTPGRFQVHVGGKPVEAIFGTKEPSWHWQDGGLVDVPGGDVELRMHDLTGFDGRCDCLWLSPDLNAHPPEKPAELEAFRLGALGFGEKAEDGGGFDLIVVGGGVAGITAALTAARTGMGVALVESRNLLGGNNSSEIRIHVSAQLKGEMPFKALGRTTSQMRAAQNICGFQEEKRWQAADSEKQELVAAQRMVRCFLEHHLLSCEVQAGVIRSIVLRDVRRGCNVRLSAPLFCDASGDAVLAAAAGATCRVGRDARADFGESRAPEKADRQVLGSTLHWWSVPTKEPQAFPETPWALPFTQENYQRAGAGAWNWETGYFWDQVAESERVRDNMLAAIYGNWSFQCRTAPERKNYANRRLAWVAHQLGKRESRRVEGDLIYSQKDIEAAAGQYDDECIPCQWGIDIHVPEKGNYRHFGERAFRSEAEHYDKGKAPVRLLPYRCLYAKDLENCFLAGRCASMSHLAHAFFRCQFTTGMMGEVVGRAARIAAEHKVTPRKVYHDHRAQLLRALDVEI